MAEICFDSGIATDDPRRLTEGTQEGPAHPVWIAEAGQLCDRVNRMATALNLKARRFEAQILDCLGRRLSRLGLEGAAELARAEMGDRRQRVHRQRLSE